MKTKEEILGMIENHTLSKAMIELSKASFQPVIDDYLNYVAKNSNVIFEYTESFKARELEKLTIYCLICQKEEEDCDLTKTVNDYIQTVGLFNS